ncbi:MAG TPA: hypothetical protein VIH72_08590 [Candidatus Acidoferrales bacterium]
MKAFYSVVIVLVICVAPVFRNASAQNAGAVNSDLHNRCETVMENSKQDAYPICKEYLEKTPNDNPERLAHIKEWVTNYEKVLPYVKYLQGLAEEHKQTCFVYEPDLKIELPETNENEAPFKMQIARSFNGSYEEEMLKKAEAVYLTPSKSFEEDFKSLYYWAEEVPKEMTPIGGTPANDDIKQTNVVTARAVRYYYDLTIAERKNPHLPSGLTAQQTNLKYDASIKHFDQYSHNKDKFEDVYVADLTLEWGFNCGGLCGMGFTRNKLVVLDREGNVIAMFLDAKVNSASWMS